MISAVVAVAGGTIQAQEKEDTVIVFRDVYDLVSNDFYGFYERANNGQLSNYDKESLEILQRVFIRDTLVISKTFRDKNGYNNLEIEVFDPCFRNLEKDRVDGLINYITVRLTNKKYSDTLFYYNPAVYASLINLIESNIFFKSISGKQAVFIPFSYCGMADDDWKITYIVLYDHKKYIYHINLRGEDFQNYKVVDDLNEKLKELPAKLKKELIYHINANCSDAFINCCEDDNQK